jgi:hypothetical protein
MPTVVNSLAGTTRASRTVPVPLGNRSYDVMIGPDCHAARQGKMRHRHRH